MERIANAATLTAALVAAMETIDQAVAVYDADDRLLMFNSHYAEWRGAIAGPVTRGARWEDLVRASVQAGAIPEAVGREEEWLAERRRVRGAYSAIRRFEDGRSFKVNERRMSDGGIVVVWTEISDLVSAQDETDAGLREAGLTNQRLTAEIKERRRAQAALNQLRLSLEERVTERTAALHAALVQRELLLREVYHRVQNNLQIVDSLIRLAAQSLTDSPAIEAISNVRRHLVSIGLVHAQLMSSDNLETFDITPFLQELVANLTRSQCARGRGIDITVASDAAPVTIDLAIPVGLIVTELLTNAAKNAQARDPKAAFAVEYRLSGDGGSVLSVTESGDDPTDPSHLMPRHGVGGKIITGLVKQLRGDLVVTYQQGTRVAISLPPPGEPE